MGNLLFEYSNFRRTRPTLKPSTEIVSKAQEFVDIYRFPPTRPAPIYPTPQVDKPAAKCRKDVCLLPDCSCGGTDIPGIFHLLLVLHSLYLQIRCAPNKNHPFFFVLMFFSFTFYLFSLLKFFIKFLKTKKKHTDDTTKFIMIFLFCYRWLFTGRSSTNRPFDIWRFGKWPQQRTLRRLVWTWSYKSQRLSNFCVLLCIARMDWL